MRKASHATQMRVQGVVNVYPQRIEVKTGYCDVPDAKSIDCVDKKSQRIIVSLGRYDWQTFLSWLNDFDFTIVGRPKKFDFDEGGIGIAAVLLRKS